MPRLLGGARTAALHALAYLCAYSVKVNRELGEGTLRDFNLGYLMELPLNGLNCICGKPLGHEPEHAICAACGLVPLSARRPPARTSATTNGRSRATAPTTSTITKSPRISTCAASSSATSRTSRRPRSASGTDGDTQERGQQERAQLHRLLRQGRRQLRLPAARVSQLRAASGTPLAK